MNLIRPNNFSEFVGKDNIKSQLQIFITSCKIKNETLPHVLFYGPPGVGKTSLAMIVANELQSKIKIIQAPQFQKTTDLLNIFSLINKNDVIFIDEIHALDPKMMEILFPAMEDFKVDILIGKEFNSKITRMKIPKFTLIGATTQYGKILSPLEERFGIVINIDHYTIYEIKKIIKNKIKFTNLSFSEEEIDIIANHSRFIPRTAIRLIDRICDYKLIEPNIEIQKIIQQMNIYDNGLVQQDINYLLALDKHKILGVKSIQSITGIDTLTIEIKIEPFLIKLNLIEKTIKGRKLSDKGKKYIKKIKYFSSK